MFLGWVSGFLLLLCGHLGFTQNDPLMIYGDKFKTILADFKTECKSPCPKDIFPNFHDFVMLFNQDGNVIRIENETLKAASQVPQNNPTVFFGIQQHPHGDYLFKGSAGYLVANEDENRIMFTSNHPCYNPDKGEEIKIKSFEEVECETDISIDCIVKKPQNPGTQCQKAKWTLFVIENEGKRMLQIRSFNKFYMTTDIDKEIILKKHESNEDAEYFFGSKTNFRTGYRLVKEDDVDCPIVSPPLNPEQCGDVVVEYITTTGEKKEGMICDFNFWNYEANKICLTLGFKGSFPTFEGQFTSYETTALPMAMMDFNCSNAETALDCDFNSASGGKNVYHLQTLEGISKSQCIADNKAGVICGSKDQIKKLKEQGEKCKGTMSELASIYSAKKQMKKLSAVLTDKYRHWGELLLPVPMAVSMVSSVLLTTASFNKVIKLRPPTSGFVHLHFIYLSPNLGYLANSIADSFLLSKRNMGLIKMNAKYIHSELKHVPDYIDVDNAIAREEVLNQTIATMMDLSRDSIVKLDGIIIAFEGTQDILAELSDTMLNTFVFDKKERELIEKLKNEEIAEEERLNKEKIALEKEISEYDQKLSEARKEFNERVEELKKKRCTNNGLDSCEKCEYQERAISTNEKGEENCLRYEKHCLEYQNSAAHCKRYVDYCTFRFFGCHTYSIRCAWYVGPSRNCKREGKLCMEPVYLEAGNYCLDTLNDKLKSNKQVSELTCGECKSYKNVLNDVETLNKNIAMMRWKMESGSHDSGAIVEILEMNTKNLNNLKNVFAKFIESRDAIAENKTITTTTIAATTITSTSTISTNSSTTASTLTTASTPTAVKAVVEKPVDRSEDPAGKIQKRKQDLEDECDMYNHNLKFQKTSLSQQNNVAKIARNVIGHGETILPIILKCSQNTALEVTFLKETLKDLVGIIENSRITIGELRKLENDKVKSLQLGGYKELGQEAETLFDTRLKSEKRARELESVADQMMKVMVSMQKNKANLNDLDEVIKYLRNIITQLNKVKAMWVQIKLFFINFEQLLKDARYDGLATKLQMFLKYPEIGTFEEKAKAESIRTLGINLYMYRVATFYDNLVDADLLNKLYTMSTHLLAYDPSKSEQVNIKNIEGLRNEVIERAVTSQKYIKEEIQKHEKKTTHIMSSDIKLVRKAMDCAKESPNVKRDDFKAAKEFEKADKKHQKDWEERNKPKENKIVKNKNQLDENSIMLIEATKQRRIIIDPPDDLDDF